MKKTKYHKFWPKLLQNLIWLFVRVALWFFADFKVFGLENLKKIPAKTGVIFASNHTSVLDPILIPAALPFMSRFLPTYNIIRFGRKPYKNKFINFLLATLKPFIKMWGAYPAPTIIHKSADSYFHSLRFHLKILTDKKSLIVFPMGGIEKSKKERPGTGIAFLINQIASSRVIPIFISFAPKTKKLDFKKFFLRKYKIKIFFGEQINYRNIFENIILETSVIDLYTAGTKNILEKLKKVKDSFI